MSADLEASLIALGSLYRDQDSETMARPIGSWLEWLESEGYDQDGLGNFFLAPEFLAYWTDTIALKDLYLKASEVQITTGEFIGELTRKNPNYVQAVARTIESLTENQRTVLATAGGTSSPHGLNRSNLNSKSKWGIRGGAGVLGVFGGYLLYKKYGGGGKTTEQSVGQAIERHTEQTIEKQVETAFGGKDKEEIGKTVAKDDLEIQAREFSQVCEDIESGKRMALHEYEHNEKVLVSQLKDLKKQYTDFQDGTFKDMEQKAIKEQESQLDNFVKDPKKFFDSEFQEEFRASPLGAEYQKEYDKLYSRHVEFDSVARQDEMTRRGVFMSEEQVFKNAWNNTLNLRKEFVGNKFLTIEKDARQIVMHEVTIGDETFLADLNSIDEYAKEAINDQLNEIESMIEKNASLKVQAMAQTELEAQGVEIQDGVEATIRSEVNTMADGFEEEVETTVSEEIDALETVAMDDVEAML